MGFKSGDRVQVESESTEAASDGRRRGGRERDGHPRYRIRWDDGHETITHRRRAR